MHKNFTAATPAWPAETVETLTAMWERGLSAAEIAARLGKTARSVESKIHSLRATGHTLASRRGASHRGTTQRRCLYCGQDFASLHPGNRLCPICLVDGPFTSAML